MEEQEGQLQDGCPMSPALVSVPHVTPFKNWKTSFRREVITDSTLRQATDWLADIGQAKSMQDMDVGSLFGSTRMSFETLDSQIARGFMKIMNPDFKRKVQVVQEQQEKTSGTPREP